MARATAGPFTDMEYELEELIAGARARTRFSQKQLSRELGFEENYLRNRKHDRELTRMPLGVVMRLAMMAGREIRFVKT